MSVLRRDRERRAIGDPGWPLVPSRGRDLTFGSVSDVDSATKIAAVWACVRVVADAIAAAPLDVYRKDAQGRRVSLDVPPLFSQPDPQFSRHDWMFSLTASLLLTGNAFAVWESLDRTGWPTRMTLVDPARVTVLDGGDYRVGSMIVPADRMTHVRAFTLPGRCRGLSPLEQFGATLGMATQAEQFGLRFFTEGGIPSSIIYSDQQMDATQADDLKQRIVSAWRGKREPAVLGAGLRYERVSVSPNESQFLESQHFTIEQICRVFGVPPEMIGHASSGSSVTYANIEQRQLAFLQFTVLPWASRIEAALTSTLPRPQFVRLNFDALVRVDLATRYKAHSMALRDGWRNANEIRELEDLGPIPEGDVFLWPLVQKSSDSGAEAPGGVPTNG